MELDLLKDTWPIVDLFDNSDARKMASTKEEENSAISIWEENYQDLSGWCIDTFQGRCAFPTGEFETSKYSGTKSEDNGVSLKKRVLIGKVSKGFLGDQDCLEDSSLKVLELPPLGDTDRSNKMEDIQLLAIKSEIIDTRSMGMNDILLMDPIDSTLNPRTSDWIQLSDVHVPNVSPLNVHRKSTKRKRNSNDTIVEYSSSTSHGDSKAGGKEDWDTISSFDNTESEPFDLLSYLCDDDIQSPDGSVISQDSGPTINSNSSITSHNDETSSLSTTRSQRKNRRKDIEKTDYDEAHSSSIATISAALDSVAKMSERTSRNKEKRKSRATRNRYDSNFEESRGKKRYLDSDSEDRMSDGSYRESREKNNEASRRSRQNKKAKENEMMTRAKELERDNRILKMKVEELDKLVTSMRTAILRSALRKSS